MTAIKECAVKLGHTPSQTELRKMANLDRSVIHRHFGKYVWALRECNLEKTGTGRRAELEVLFRDWARVARKLKRSPASGIRGTSASIARHLSASASGNGSRWHKALKSMRKSTAGRRQWRDVLGIIAAQEGKKPGAREDRTTQRSGPRLLRDARVWRRDACVARWPMGRQRGRSGLPVWCARGTAGLCGDAHTVELSRLRGHAAGWTSTDGSGYGLSLNTRAEIS